MRFLCLLLPFLAGCSTADAATKAMPSIAVEIVGDSARLIARWSRPCDDRGCADAYSVRWNGSIPRFRTDRADTSTWKMPAAGDSLTVRVDIQSIRRGVSGAVRSATTTLRTPDAPPPPVDSLRVDTLDVQAALLDSFPSTTQRILRSELGVGDSTFICALAKNRYTGRVRIVVDPSWNNEEVAEVNLRCEILRRGLETERDG
jgi:hypothetical protein